MPEHPKAKRTRDGLNSAAEEFHRLAKTIESAAGREMAEIDAKYCEDGAKLIEVLDTEVFRLRAAIGSYLYGRMDQHSLREISQSWNAH